MSIQDILHHKSNHVVCVAPDTPVSTAALRLKAERIGALVISSDGQHIDGILSERDIVHGLCDHKGEVLSMPVSALMSHNVVTCTPDASVADVMRLMTQHRVRHMPVVKGTKLFGIVSIGDVVKNRLSDMELETNVLRDYAVAHH